MTCSSENLARLALTMCPNLEKLRFDVVLLAGMQRYFRAACVGISILLLGVATGTGLVGGSTGTSVPSARASVTTLGEL